MVYMKRIGVVVTNLAGSGAEKVALTQAKLFREKPTLADTGSEDSIPEWGRCI